MNVTVVLTSSTDLLFYYVSRVKTKPERMVFVFFFTDRTLHFLDVLSTHADSRVTLYSLFTFDYVFSGTRNHTQIPDMKDRSIGEISSPTIEPVQYFRPVPYTLILTHFSCLGSCLPPSLQIVRYESLQLKDEIYVSLRSKWITTPHSIIYTFKIKSIWKTPF